MQSAPTLSGTAPAQATRTVLFLCTGNYYRSRFAEALFNHLAPVLCPGWVAHSRGLALERGSANVGPISRSTRSALTARAVPVPDSPRCPEPVTTDDLARADHVVAVQNREHRPLLVERHADWAAAHLATVTFWDVADIDRLDPPTALAQLDTHVRALCRELGERDASPASYRDLAPRVSVAGKHPSGEGQL